jgi:hypothetical protein
MAEYCSQCSSYKNNFDYDLFKIALGLKNGYSEGFFCEGCSNRGIYKDETGKLFIAKLVKGEIELQAVNIEELIR